MPSSDMGNDKSRIIQALVEGAQTEPARPELITRSDANALRAIGAVWPNYQPGERESANVEVRPANLNGLSAQERAVVFASIFGNEMGALGARSLRSIRKSLGMNVDEGQQMLPGPRMEPR